MTHIAWLGLGAMGVRMAQHLLEDGHAVTVYNRTAARTAPLVERGARAAATPRAAVAGAEVVIAMVRDDDASRAVWCDPDTGALAALDARALAIASSTLTVGWTRSLAAEIANHSGAAFLDAPVLGSRPQADARQLIHLVGGETAAVDRARPILEALGGALHHVGPIGHGMTMKLVANALFGAQVAALGELLGWLDRAEVDRATALDVLGSLPIVSPAMRGIAGLISQRAFAPLFPIALVEKDLGYAVAEADAAGSPLPTVAAVRAVYADAIARGFGDDNITGVAQLFD
ncbi:MAG: NAD(P)-dependent oxidoreductase [Acidobacteriota bacterium]